MNTSALNYLQTNEKEPQSTDKIIKRPSKAMNSILNRSHKNQQGKGERET